MSSLYQNIPQADKESFFQCVRASFIMKKTKTLEARCIRMHVSKQGFRPLFEAEQNLIEQKRFQDEKVVAHHNQEK